MKEKEYYSKIKEIIEELRFKEYDIIGHTFYNLMDVEDAPRSECDEFEFLLLLNEKGFNEEIKKKIEEWVEKKSEDGLISLTNWK